MFLNVIIWTKFPWLFSVEFAKLCDVAKNMPKHISHFNWQKHIYSQNLSKQIARENDLILPGGVGGGGGLGGIFTMVKKANAGLGYVANKPQLR